MFFSPLGFTGNEVAPGSDLDFDLAAGALPGPVGLAGFAFFSSSRGASSIESPEARSRPPWRRLMPESLGLARLTPDAEATAPVTSESDGLRWVASNSSLPSSAVSSKSLPESGWRASITLEGVS
jgi:hypothetical protein